MNHNLFGTDGIRCQFGTEILRRPNLHALGRALAAWACEYYNPTPTLLVLHDTRLSCYLIKASLKTGLLMAPLKVYDAGILPTPAALHLLALNQHFDAAIIISASHNPSSDNGIKIIDKKFGKLTEEQEQKISHLVKVYEHRHDDYKSPGFEVMYNKASVNYCSEILSKFKPNLLSGLTIVLDTAHGALYDVAPIIFKELGAHVITIANQPNGLNINDQCGSQYPELLRQAVLEHSADIGFAFDGDGDRVIAVSKHGLIKNGDDILALLIHHPRYKNTQAVVGTIMSNSGLEHYLALYSKQLIRVSVGDRHIAERLDHNIFLGGEQSGHIILNDRLKTGDGILVALTLIEAIMVTHNWEMKTFCTLPQVLVNIPIKIKKNLNSEPFCDIINKAQKQVYPGRLLVRFSGTEPLLRIMVEASEHKDALEISNTLAHNLSILLK